MKKRVTHRVVHEDFERWSIFFIGNSKCCFAFTLDHRIIKISYSLDVLDSELPKDCFLRINYYTIVNTKFLVHKNEKREIIMKDGSIHKVSRQKWKAFQ
jgi:DNA-binding LytR/AlgR family response regulator